ncbi:MAG: HD domain-containing protein [Desulfobacterales bacterium]|nr:HD domain-containing protein [Desulfobacterales bacterium]
MKPTLDEHIQRDPRILKVYLEARRRYSEFKFKHHNFGHVMRDLHRALVIAADQGSVDYNILIPSVLLHDIGFCSPDFKKLGHDVAGARLAVEILNDLDYTDDECAAVGHCIHAHKGKAELPRTIEAQILYDADVLEKAGLVFLIWGGNVISEFNESIQHFLQREIADRGAEVARGLYTRKARELDGGRLEKVGAMFQEIRKEITEERSDYEITEDDLWQCAPP